VILILFLFVNLTLLWINSISTIKQQPTINQVAFEDEEKYVQLIYLPVDIDEVFWADNLTRQSEHLNLIKIGTDAWMLPSWAGVLLVVIQKELTNGILFSLGYL
jgi:hypothetical protein